ncbi:MAG: NAD(P)H-hydrate epimerase, partial [Phycisphaerae bacterium]
MENAARGVCDLLLSLKPDGHILILCGPGNNGGDGLCLARLLAATGTNSRVHLLHHGRRLSPDAAANLSFLRKSGCPVEEEHYDLLSDEL